MPFGLFRARFTVLAGALLLAGLAGPAFPGSLARPGRALADGCAPAADHLCLNGSRFQAEVTWAVPGLGSGPGHALALTGDTGAFWFFSGSNLELVVKVLDGRALNRHFWVFYGGLSDVEYTLTVTDTRTGVRETYHNPAGKLASASDVTAFDEEAPGAASQAALAAAAVPPATGPEFQVNTTTNGMQWQPAVAMAPGGGFLVAWQGVGGIDARLYDAAGNPRTGEIRLSDDAGFYYTQSGPRVAASSSGGYLVTWQFGTRSWVRYVAPDGGLPGASVPLGQRFRSQSLPDVAADPVTGGFLAVWLDGAGQVDQGVLHAQRFDSQGSPAGGESEIGPQIDHPVRVIASPAGGGFLLSWSETAQNAYFSRALALRLDPAAQPVGAPIEATPAGGVQGELTQVQPVFHPDGGFSVIWSLFSTAPQGTSLFARRFLPDGRPAGDPVALWAGELFYPQPPLAVLPLASGNTWVFWSAWSAQDDSDGAVLAGVFDPSWSLQGAVARMNVFTGGWQSSPAVAGGPAGAMAVWQSGVYPPPIDPIPPPNPAQNQDGSYMGVIGRRFNPTCALDGGQLCLNGRFRVTVQFTDPRPGQSGQTGNGQALPLTGDTGAFWFFDPANVELVVKVLDGRALNGHFWVYAGALSDVAYTITVTDTVTGQSRAYANAPHQLASRSDTSAF